MNPDVPSPSDSLDKLHQRVRQHVDEAMRTMPLDRQKSFAVNAVSILLHLLAMVVNIAKEFAEQAGLEQTGKDEVDKLWEKNDVSDVCDLDRILKCTKLLK
ncbi:hypothetical protein ColLi_12372 [Colletotrichum liriopes]|uniref:Uncharacterized protein n=1 Tax=Colletotrichum liriopes TaxID=708192 RepID=A0AA37GYA3_9PEZI|nr:hypothetical protein ColLi_12372 [Colletotrichum liriopes]